MHTNSIHARMRRVVEKENKDIEPIVDSKSKSQSIRMQRSKKNSPLRFNPCLALILLSPLAILGAFIGVSKYHKRWIEADSIVDSDPHEQQHLAQQQQQHQEKKKMVNNLHTTDIHQHQHQRIRGGNTANSNAHNAKDSNEPQKRIAQQLQQPRADPTAQDDNNNNNNKNRPKFLVLKTKHGNIQITLRPDLSKESVDYIYELVESYGGNGQRCTHCNFYRSQKEGILQGIMEHKGVVPTNTVRGSCPPGAEQVPNICPKWDAHCGCHGPVMHRGAVAWAAGQAGGPDFFISGYAMPATWWGTQHTNFGMIETPASLEVVDAIFALPTKSQNGMSILEEPIHFDFLLLDET